MSGTIDTGNGVYVLNVTPSLPDLNAWQFSPPEGLEIPDVIELDKDWPAALQVPFDQGQEGSCTGNAQSKLWDITAVGQGIPTITPSRRFIYNRSRHYEGTDNQDAGSTILDSIRGLAEFGVCSEFEMPYIPGQYTLQPTQQQLTDALEHQALKYEQVAQTVDMVGASLALRRPVSVGFVVYQNFYPANGLIPMPSGGVLGGHNVLVVGRNNSQRLLKVFNSWGNWGLAGFAWMPYDYLLNPQLCFELRTIDLVEGTPTPPPPGPSESDYQALQRILGHVSGFRVDFSKSSPWYFPIG